MKKVIQGLQKFSRIVHHQHQELFDALSLGQNPHTLFITCSDSRIDPGLITQTAPGEIFVLRNAGNILPPYGTANGGEEATIEFGIEGLKIQNIVVCGHTHCMAMNGLMLPERIASMKSVVKWLQHAEETRKICQEQFQRTGNLLQVTEENVKVQIRNLKTYPAVIKAFQERTLSIYGMVYHLETGIVSLYDPAVDTFIPSSELEFEEEQQLKKFSIPF